jgi:hypothetical protein
MYNVISYNYGTKVRPGYQQWATTVGAGGVKTIVPYTGTVAANDRLFAMGNNGIYDVTSSVATPTVKLAYTASANSGNGIWCAVTTVAGFFSAYCDEDNGYYLYTESTDTWAAVTTAQVTGVNPNTFCYVISFKERLWFIQKNTSSAWYLPTDAITGAATQFNFGNKFQQGGTLQALYSWTVQGSTGPQNCLVAISSSGEVIIYGGDDPTDASNWQVIGSWFIGTTPVGRRFAGNIGGDLYILSVAGLQPLSSIIQGSQVQIENIEVSRKVSPAVRSALASTYGTYGWEVKAYPMQAALFVMTPQVTGSANQQFVQSLNNQGWSIWQSLPMYTGEVWHGQFYFGGLDGNVYTITGDTDAVPRTGGNGNNIASYILSSFQDYNELGLYHIGQLVRPIFLSPILPQYSCKIVYDYNISEQFVNGGTSPITQPEWDVAVWDTSIWGSQPVEVQAVSGANGVGRAMAISLSMNTSNPTTLIRTDIIGDTGGWL